MKQLPDIIKPHERLSGLLLNGQEYVDSILKRQKRLKMRLLLAKIRDKAQGRH